MHFDQRPPNAPLYERIDVEGMIIAYLLNALADDHVGVHVANAIDVGEIDECNRCPIVEAAAFLHVVNPDVDVRRAERSA